MRTSVFVSLLVMCGTGRVVYARLQFGSSVYTSKEIARKPGPVDLRIRGNEDAVLLFYGRF